MWDFLSYFVVSANKFDIFRQCTYIVFILQSKNPKTTATLSKKSRIKRFSSFFLSCPLRCLCLYCYHFLSLLNMNQVPEKLYLFFFFYLFFKSRFYNPLYITTWLGYTGVFKRNQWKNKDYFIFYKLNFKRVTKKN